MANYICECCDYEESKSGVSIKFIDGKAQHDIKCSCGKHMTLKEPKTGVPSFRRDSHGRVY
jgi:hypothetical protein